MPNNAAYQNSSGPPGLLITRPSASANRFAQAVRRRLARSLRIVISPILKISYLPLTRDLESYPTIIVTSTHAIQALVNATSRRDFTFYAVGKASMECAAKEGFNAVDGGGTAESLAQRVIAERPCVPCLYLRGEHISQDVSKSLNLAGIDTHEEVIYQQNVTPLTEEALELLSSGRRIILPIFSARSAELFFTNHAAKGPLDVIAMSRNVAAKVPKESMREIRVSQRPDTEAMIDEIAQLLGDTNQLEGRVSPE